jgi:transcriptional regulator with XRE-family HTH domain
MKDSNMEVNLRAKRKARGKKIEAIAAKFNKHKATVYGWEAGEYAPDEELIPAVAKEYGISPERFAMHFEEQRERRKMARKTNSK